MSIRNSFARRKALVVLAAFVGGLGLSVATDVGAAVEPAAACAASKQKAAAKKLSDKVKCHGVAIKKAIAVDAACLTKAETKFEDAFQKAESKGGCATNADVDDIELLIDDTLDQLLAALPAAVEDCDNTIDDDGNGFTDCADFSCAADPACFESNCTDVVDNDGDGFTDCADSDCDPDPACASDCGNNIREGAEECDGSDFDGAQCSNVVPATPNGTLLCTLACEFDTTSCIP